MTIKPFVDQQDRMEKARNAIAVPNRSLILTVLNRIFVVDILLTLPVANHNREETEERS